MRIPTAKLVRRLANVVPKNAGESAALMRNWIRRKVGAPYGASTLAGSEASLALCDRLDMRYFAAI
jgi:hypothetical protein